MGRKPSLFFVKSCGDQQLDVVAWDEVENTDDVSVWNWGEDVGFDTGWRWIPFPRLPKLNDKAPHSSPANTTRGKPAMVDSVQHILLLLERTSESAKAVRGGRGELGRRNRARNGINSYVRDLHLNRPLARVFELKRSSISLTCAA